MKNKEFTKVDTPKGICPGCGNVGDLTIMFRSTVQDVRACSPACWNKHFADYLGRLEIVESDSRDPDAFSGVTRSTHQKNSASFTAYGPEPGRDPDPVGRAAAVRIVDELISGRLRDQKILAAAAEVVKIWNDPGHSPATHEAAKFVLSGNWRRLHNALIKLAKSTE